MADMFTPQRRSEIMSRIKSKNSKAEIIVFRFLKSKGVYFQKHYGRIYGKPDIALPRKKIAVFIDGDFWHGRSLERVKARTANPYWTKKIENNINRDVKVNSELNNLGWKVLRVWESDINRKKTRDEVLDNIQMFLVAHKA